MAKKQKQKTKSRSKIVKELDSIFSKYIRVKYSNKKWYCKCITCWKIDHYKKLHCGHFISRKVYKYRWSIENCFPQCPWCNIFLSGNYIKYTLFMIDKFWIEKVKYMENDKEILKVSTSELLDKIEYYSNELQKYNKKF